MLKDKRPQPIDSTNDKDSGPAASRIRLNPKTKKVGAPNKLKKVTAAGEQKDRKWYVQAKRGRKHAGEVTLEDLMEALTREQRSLHTTQRHLSGVIVKYGEVDGKKPKFRVVKNSVLTIDPFYILPPKLLAACVKCLPVSNTAEDAIEAHASQDTAPGVPKAKYSIAKEVVVIKDVGIYTREQIELFARVQNLKEVVDLGLGMQKWLTCEGIPSLPAVYHELGNKVAEEVPNTYPYMMIQSLPQMPDFVYSMLYRVTPPTWLSDAPIRAVCLRLSDDFDSCRFGGFLSVVESKKRTRKSDGGPVNQELRDRVLQLVTDPGVETILIPLNFQNAHWCCVVVRVSVKRIWYYDPLNQTSYLNAGNAVATQLKISGLQNYDLVQMNNSIQLDAYSCGVYMCWMFILLVAPVPPQDMSAYALPRRSFELFYYLLTGTLISLQEKLQRREDENVPVHPPATTEEEDEEDAVPTQVAQ